MGWTIAAIGLAVICAAQWYLLVKQNEVIDEQMDLMRGYKSSIDLCLAAWGKLRLVPQVRFLLDHDGTTMVAEHEDPEMRRQGQEAVDELQRTIEEIKGLKRLN